VCGPAAFGIHPHHAKYYTDSLEERVMEAASHPKCVAWGECGLDYHSKQLLSPKGARLWGSLVELMLSFNCVHVCTDAQIRAFKRQIELALILNKPIVIHSRDAEEDTLMVLNECLAATGHQAHPVHMHCYSGTDRFTTTLLTTYPGTLWCHLCLYACIVHKR
jgi:TatD DNase family protein